MPNFDLSEDHFVGFCDDADPPSISTTRVTPRKATQNLEKVITKAPSSPISDLRGPVNVQEGRASGLIRYSLSPAVIWVAESWPSEAAAASGHTQPVKSG